jgi:hypothetical protein
VPVENFTASESVTDKDRKAYEQPDFELFHVPEEPPPPELA